MQHAARLRATRTYAIGNDYDAGALWPTVSQHARERFSYGRADAGAPAVQVIQNPRQLIRPTLNPRAWGREGKELCSTFRAFAPFGRGPGAHCVRTRPISDRDSGIFLIPRGAPPPPRGGSSRASPAPRPPRGRARPPLPLPAPPRKAIQHVV